jgi:hypothetical protein
VHTGTIDMIGCKDTVPSVTSACFWSLDGCSPSLETGTICHKEPYGHLGPDSLVRR